MQGPPPSLIPLRRILRASSATLHSPRADCAFTNKAAFKVAYTTTENYKNEKKFFFRILRDSRHRCTSVTDWMFPRNFPSVVFRALLDFHAEMATIRDFLLINVHYAFVNSRVNRSTFASNNDYPTYLKTMATLQKRVTRLTFFNSFLHSSDEHSQ